VTAMSPAAAAGAATPPVAMIRTIRIGDVRPVQAACLTSVAALPVYPGMLCAIVGEGESGKTWIATHTAADVAVAGHAVLVLDGEMSATAWLGRFRALGIPDDALQRVYYAEMADDSANVASLRATVAHHRVRLVVWDSALSLIARTARSENDNAEVARLYDRLREVVRDGPAGLLVDHTTRGSSSLVSRGATAKFNALDISYGVRLAEGSVPGQAAEWSSKVSVEKDRHGLLGERRDREVIFIPRGSGNLEMDISESHGSTHRLAAGNPLTALVARIAALDPPAKSGNDAVTRLKGRRAAVQNAYRIWSAQNQA
jgi:hypothetical protein